MTVPTPAEEVRAASERVARGDGPAIPPDLEVPLSELLEHIADDMSEAQAVERPHKTVRGETWLGVHPEAPGDDTGARFDWTSALAAARVINMDAE